MLWAFPLPYHPASLWHCFEATRLPGWQRWCPPQCRRLWPAFACAQIAGVDVVFQILMAVAAAAPCAKVTQLYQAVFPDQVYDHTKDQRARLAAELRRTAELLDPGQCVMCACIWHRTSPAGCTLCTLSKRLQTAQSQDQFLKTQTTGNWRHPVETVHVCTLASHRRHGLHLRSGGRMVTSKLLKQSVKMYAL